jgi:hypothetical protein
VKAFHTIDPTRLLRPSLGEESLESVLKPKLDDLAKRLHFALKYAPQVNDVYVNHVHNYLNTINQHLNSQAQRSNADYVSNREAFLQAFSEQVEVMKQHWAHFVAAAVEARGFLDDEGIRNEYQNAVEALKKEAKTTLESMKEETKKAIDEAKLLAEQIENKARRTATKTSVEEAQKQFKEAQAEHDRQVKSWARASVVSLGIFFIVAIVFLFYKLPDNETWQVVYHTAIRVTILASIGAVSAFCLRILRAHMHMRQHNLHRQRVANSISSFVESAATPEQRDLILAHLVEAIALFGSSGLIQKTDDNIYTPRMTIDSIARTFTHPPA